MLWSPGHRQTHSFRVCSPSSRRVATLCPRYAGLSALTTAPPTHVQTGSYPTMPGPDPLHVAVDDLSSFRRFRATVDNHTLLRLPLPDLRRRCRRDARDSLRTDLLFRIRWPDSCLTPDPPLPPISFAVTGAGMTRRTPGWFSSPAISVLGATAQRRRDAGRRRSSHVGCHPRGVRRSTPRDSALWSRTASSANSSSARAPRRQGARCRSPRLRRAIGLDTGSARAPNRQLPDDAGP